MILELLRRAVREQSWFAADLRETETALEEALVHNEQTKTRFDSLDAAFMAALMRVETELKR